MKKLLLTFVGIALVITAVAKQNPFKKSKDRLEKRQKMISNKPYKNHLNSSNISVATLIKESSWDLNSNSWLPYRAYKDVYQNDLLAISYYMSYDLADTIGRTIFAYNSDKKMISYISEYQNSPGVFVPSFRYNFTYSNNYKKEVVVGEVYDSQTQTWQFDSRYTSEYDSRGHETKYIAEFYTNGQWEIVFGFAGKITYINNNSSKILEITDSTFNTSIMAFEPEYKETRLYNGNEEIEHITYFGNNNGQFGVEARDSLFYTSGAPSKLIQNGYDEMTSSFVRMVKLDDLIWSNFNPSIDIFENQPSEYKVSVWNNTAWEYTNRYSFQNLDNYGSVSTLSEVYINNIWVPDYKAKDLYNSHYTHIEYTEEEYDSQLSTWGIIYSFKYHYQYDMNNNPTEKYDESYNSISGVYEKHRKEEFLNYITIASGINNLKNTIENKLFPNPSNDGRVFVNVKMEKASDLKIEVLDLNGKTISSQTKNLGIGMNTIELNMLNHGLYFVVLTSDFGISRTKLMVK